jgi:hypothetical protein
VKPTYYARMKARKMESQDKLAALLAMADEGQPIAALIRCVQAADLLANGNHTSWDGNWQRWVDARAALDAILPK